jgi:hypothetical protein
VIDDARRADWRFLLPDPQLGGVAYLPPHDTELVRALEACGASVDLGGASHAAEVVVITGGGPAGIARGRELLRAGGWLYAEVPGWRTPAWERALRRSDFDEVAAHWLWPSARGCREIVPLEPLALRHALQRRDPGARLRLRARVAGLVARTRLFRLALRHTAVVARCSAP